MIAELTIYCVLFLPCSEIVQKDVGRFDLNMDHVDDAVADAGEVGFISAVRRHAEDAIRPLLIDLFGADYVLNGKGVVISCPGATAQNWHVDSSHLFTQSQLGPLISSSSSTPTPTPLRLPCHFVTVFVPLYHARPEVGPTQV